MLRVQGLGRETLYPKMIYTEYGDGGGCFRVTIIALLNLASAVASLAALLKVGPANGEDGSIRD